MPDVTEKDLKVLVKFELSNRSLIFLHEDFTAGYANP